VPPSLTGYYDLRGFCYTPVRGNVRSPGSRTFDEPDFVALVPETEYIVSFHGAVRAAFGTTLATMCGSPAGGNEMLLHYGIDEPDFFECVLLKCGHKWQVASDNAPGSESGEEG